MRSAVVDSTVLVSAFLTPSGVSALLLRHAHGGVVSAFLSEDILAETQNVLLDDGRRIRRRYHYPNESVHLFIEGLRAMITPEHFMRLLREQGLIG
jgi:predicted nucleic acid-binding protein